MNKKTYLFAKFGKSIKFNPKTWSGFGGDVEAPSLIRAFARNNPDANIIIVGKNDLEKYKVQEENIYSAQEFYKKLNPNVKKIDYHFLNEILNDIKVDGVFLIAGPAGTSNIPNKVFKRKEWEKESKIVYAKCLECNVNYVAHLVEYLNKTKIPWIHILNDPRYKQIGRDLLFPPKVCLSQYNETITYNSMDNFEDQNLVKYQAPGVYSGVEKMFLSYYSDFNDKDIKKDIKFLIVLNEGENGVKSRYTELKKYVLDYFEDVDIYGKWKKDTIKDDKRFKGSIPFIELQELIPRVKYTFIIPITKGWVTMKFWEMVVNGIIPFMHPDYDSQNNLGVPDFLRIKNPAELKKKIDFLEKNPDKYEKLLEKLRSFITQGDFSGKNLSDTLLSYSEKYKSEYEEFNKNRIDFNPDDFKSKEEQEANELEEW